MAKLAGGDMENLEQVKLNQDGTLALTTAQASRMECVTGVVWATREGDPRDLFLAPGDWLEVGSGLMLVTALEPAILRLSLPCSRPRQCWIALRRWLRRAGTFQRKGHAA